MQDTSLTVLRYFSISRINTDLRGYRSIIMTQYALVREAASQQYDAVAANKTLDKWYLNYHRGWWWGSGLMGYWAFLILVSSIEHLGSKIFPHTSMKMKQRISQLAPVRWFRRLVTMPALFNGKHTERNFIGGIVPTRFESLVIFIYFVFVILSESVNINYYDRFTWYTDKKTQIARYVGDRSAVITCFIIIPAFLFAGRNNFLLWLTGWKMSTFYAFHKWLARMAIFSAFVHTITMFEVMKWSHSISRVKMDAWWIWGAIAMTSGGVIFVQSFPYLRAMLYDAFLFCHIVLAVFWLVGMWIHVRDLECGQYAYACGAVWVFDRFLRILKIASFGIRQAHFELVSGEIVVMTVPSVAPLRKPTPGSFGYVHFLDSWFFFQSHPFSLIMDGDEVKFLIKGKNGITKRLINKMRNMPQGRCTERILIEGFYGEYSTAYAYDQVLIIAGGNGIVGLYEYIKDINEKKFQGKSRTKYVKFYWVIRHWRSIDWLYPELKKLQELDYVQPIIYVTKYSDYKIGDRFSYNNSYDSSKESSLTAKLIEIPEAPKEDAAEEISSHDKSAVTAETTEIVVDVQEFSDRIKKDLPHVEFRSERPDVKQLIHDDIQEAGPHDNVAVLSCAINQMCDDIRQSVAQEVSSSRSGRIDLVELLQVW
ncbi:hypothetical protein ZYGR_0AZ02470 [Zygosaccharomyces rouxii]|uniref:FAD-binding FR-type domain-containing protein n=1 Tax=Zygosaccharomyces rouxii TaxID=4956 RepID=A0A1Q3AKA1_ZYGRO|nr:hypothetical protein ZYGR_0AZ02470 [Zygosaccharomyces rouxii]